jgi:bifunctional pyridoxal-dependent enzyme with beta-cystathionase and maltose regulon repressor activities
MFVLIDVRGTGLSGREFTQGLFDSQRLSVLDGGVFGQGTRGFVRLCFATDEAELAEAAARIRRYCNELSR